MARTYRNTKYCTHIRAPRYKWKLLAGYSRKTVTTDWDDKPVAAMKEVHNQRTK